MDKNKRKNQSFDTLLLINKTDDDISELDSHGEEISPDEDDDDIIIYCPFCKKLISSEYFEEDDYVKDNCLFWCLDNCREILICPTGVNSSLDEMANLYKGKIENSCSKLLNKTEAKKYAKKMNFKITVNLDKYYAYKIGIMHIIGISTGADSGSDSDSEIKSDARDPAKLTYLSVNAFCFKDIPKEIDTRHDGTYLYYTAECSVCHKEYKSYIWGD